MGRVARAGDRGRPDNHGPSGGCTVLSFVSYHTQTSDPDRSHVTDLAIVSLDGGGVLYAMTRLDGVISA